MEVGKTEFIKVTVQHLMPFSLAILLFLWNFPYYNVSTFFSSITTLQNAVISLTFIWIGFGFLIEVFYAMPEIKGEKVVGAGVVVWTALLIASFAIGILVFTGNSSVISGSFFGLLFYLIPAFGILAFGWQARNIIFHGHAKYLAFLHERG